MNTDNDMKNGTVIVAITRKGVILGRLLRGLLPDSDLYLPEKLAGKPRPDEHLFSYAVKEVVRQVFPLYRYMVLIMATGIAVRLLVPELRDKHQDPGVIVVDEAGSFCISLLSGHIGGANELAGKIASLLGAQPVITTASDVNETISLDLLGRGFGWEIEDDTHLKAASVALVNGEPVGVYQDTGEPNWWPETSPLPDNITVYPGLEALQQSVSSAALIITDHILDEEFYSSLPNHTLIYRPKSLVLGIGCNRGTGCAAIETAVSQALSSYTLSAKCIKTIVTIDLKRNEAGLLKFARNHRLSVEYYDRETLRKTRFPSGPSAAAMRHVGTPSVCEAAALLSSRASNLLVPKVSFGRSVTVAVARFAYGSEKEKRGKLCLVGTGRGDPNYMTLKAREAINDSEVIVGYKAYIDLIQPFLRQKEIIATGMGAEVERARKAIDIARDGRKVSLISSGDTGIYGMAGLVGEMMSEQGGNDFDIEVVSGVPSLVASAALLGSPISGDFVSISLSDYLVPWEEIAMRLKMATQANFIIVLYNPRSKKRRHQLAEARDIIIQYQSPSTPAGVVTNACRQNQEVVITDLEHLLEHEVSMNTTIIIGNAATFVSDGRMVTPRGYKTKYNLK